MFGVPLYDIFLVKAALRSPFIFLRLLDFNLLWLFHFFGIAQEIHIFNLLKIVHRFWNDLLIHDSINVLSYNFGASIKDGPYTT